MFFSTTDLKNRAEYLDTRMPNQDDLAAAFMSYTALADSLSSIIHSETLVKGSASHTNSEKSLKQDYCDVMENSVEIEQQHDLKK